MKALTIRQPFATAIALGIKKFETRSKVTHYRGQLAIHAALKEDRASERWYFSKALNDVHDFGTKEEYDQLRRIHRLWMDEELPHGQVIAIVDVVDCHSTDDVKFDASVSALERAMGDYQPFRYAWELANVVPITPVPVRGQQGFWEWSQ